MLLQVRTSVDAAQVRRTVVSQVQERVLGPAEKGQVRRRVIEFILSIRLHGPVDARMWRHWVSYWLVRDRGCRIRKGCSSEDISS